ncbi:MULTISPECIES: hypothetical protein [Flammeovirga]|uniref:Tetratricopeptide repeat protein n=1 Tax=Flammeovirga agarivorans TaxID=2726742 RepID=A0A7X8SKY9_9BACT|nr:MULTISPECIES: hypothetical protein [Flammeovirga]NLR92047.1 hypothetical protein [Flammeovirga agarivorans]
MKTVISTVLVSLIVLLSSFAVPTSLEEAPTEEKMSLLIKMVNSAENNDWETLNKAAQYSINWNADLELAKEWLDASLNISDNAEAYELLGDYHLRKGEITKAYGYYAKALQKGIFTLSKKDMHRIQRKNMVYGRALR